MALPNIPSSSSGPRIPPSSTWEVSSKVHSIPTFHNQTQHPYLSESQPPVPPHPHPHTPLSSFSDPLFGLHPHTGSGHLGSTTALAADLPIVFHVGDQGSHAHSPSHSTPPSMGSSSFPSPMPRIEFAVPQAPGKARKRHKVATSCNRCRQNKRKCNSEVPCSNCKRNNVDCCYTDAQMSRSVWGDSPLSQEKVQGVAATRRPNFGGSVSGRTSVWMGGSGGLGYPAYQFISKPTTQGSLPANRAHQVLHQQSRQLGKAMRVAHPGPQHPQTQTQTHVHSPHPQSPHPQQHHQHQFVSREFSGNGANMRAAPGGMPRNEAAPSGSMQPSAVKNMSDSSSYPAATSDGVTVHHRHNNSNGYGTLFELGTSSSQPSSSSSQVYLPLSTPSLSTSSLLDVPPPAQQAHQQQTATSSGQGPSQSSLPIYSTPYTDYGLTSAEQATERLAYDSYAPNKDPFDTPWNAGPLSRSPSSGNTSITSATVPTKRSRRMQRIAWDMLAVKRYDLSIVIPRHISQEQDEFWVAPETSPRSLCGLPDHLLMLPRDANYLVDVFFEHAYFYYPIINRAMIEVYLMEPQSPQALFLLNLTFMAACKHLARASDIKRATQFRERARELLFHIEGKLRLSRMQGVLLGSMVVYGVFTPVVGLAHMCGTHKAWPTISSSSTATLASTAESILTDHSSSSTPTSPERLSSVPIEELGSFPDLHAESHAIQAKKGVIPDAVYQARLWVFWGFFVRDSIARLYYGWPHGLDTMAVTAELPKIEGVVGLGGKAPPRVHVSTSTWNAPSAVIGKRPPEKMKRDRERVDKIRLGRKHDGPTPTGHNHQLYRGGADIFDDEEEDEEEEEDDGWSFNDEEDFLGFQDEEAADLDRDETGKFRFLFGAEVDSQDTTPSSPSRRTQVGSSAPKVYSSLSKPILNQQSKGQHPAVPSSQNDPEYRIHMERMQDLIAAQDDTTDSGSYARALFLEEIKLWSIGRRIAMYLGERTPGATTAVSAVCPIAAIVSGDSSNGNAGGQWSEQAWIQDQELQVLQAELIAWEQALPAHFRFCQQVDQEGVNHKVNGKMGLLMMYYYTITIMLQSAYLPIQQYLACAKATSSHSRSPSAKPESLNSKKPTQTPSSDRGKSPSTTGHSRQASDASVASVSTTATSTSTGTQTPQVTDAFLTATAAALEESLTTSQDPRAYVNTAHRICSHLSNTILHHCELLIDSYPNWCVFQAKVNHSLCAAMRVCCLNAKLSTNTSAIRQEAKAGFKMGSDLFKRLALLPTPLTIRDWPAEEDLNLMREIEEEFRLLMTQEEDEEDEEVVDGEEKEKEKGKDKEKEEKQNISTTAATEPRVEETGDKDKDPSSSSCVMSRCIDPEVAATELEIRLLSDSMLPLPGMEEEKFTFEYASNS